MHDPRWRSFQGAFPGQIAYVMFMFRWSFSEQVCFKPGIGNTPGCRALTRQSLDRMCSRAKCTILHKISNDYLDAYVLSESSLFVYPRKASARVQQACVRCTTLSRCAPLFASLFNIDQVVDGASVRGTFFSCEGVAKDLFNSTHPGTCWGFCWISSLMLWRCFGASWRRL